MRTRQDWSFTDTLLLTDYVEAHHGLPWAGAAPAHPELRFTELRDALFPTRTTDSVYMHAWGIAQEMGYAANQNNSVRSAQLSHVVALFNDDPVEMSKLALDIRLLRQIRR